MEDFEILISIRNALGYDKKNWHDFSKSLGYANHRSYNHIERGTFPLNEKLKVQLIEKFNVNPYYLNSGLGVMFLKSPKKILAKGKFEFDNRLRLLRKQSGLLKLDLANILGCSKYEYTLLEKNKNMLTQDQLDILNKMNFNTQLLIPDKIKTCLYEENLEINQRLNQLRKFLRLTQFTMANKLGYNTTIYSLIETEKAFLLRSKLNLIEQMGVNIPWLLTGKGEMLANF